MRAKGALVWGVTNKLISIFNSYVRFPPLFPSPKRLPQRFFPPLSRSDVLCFQQVNTVALGAIGWKY